jgi:hypothetical protein
MSDNGFQVQILMPDDAATEFLADPDLMASGILIEDTQPAEDTATLGFDLVGAIIIIKAVVQGLAAIMELAAPLARMLKKSRKRVVVTTALGTITLDPDPPLTADQIRELLSKLATL